MRFTAIPHTPWEELSTSVTSGDGFATLMFPEEIRSKRKKVQDKEMALGAGDTDRWQSKGSSMSCSAPSSCWMSARAWPPCLWDCREQPLYWTTCFIHLVSNSSHFKVQMQASRMHISPTKCWLQHSWGLRTNAYTSARDFFTTFFPKPCAVLFPRQCRLRKRKIFKTSL